MTNYEQAIDQAVEDAPSVYLDEVGMPSSRNPELAKQFENTTDYTKVLWGMGATAVTEGNQIIVPDLKELDNLQRQITVVAGYSDVTALLGRAGHEGEHATAANVLEAGRIALGTSFWKIFPTRSSQGYTIGSQPFMNAMDLETIKLGIGAMIAYPIEPSPGDLIDLAALDYDVDEVGFKATAHNRKYDNKIPVPRSYKPSRRRIIPLLRRHP